MAKTQAALAAQMIRKEIKAAFPGLSFTCRSQNYLGGNSVDVEMIDQPQAIKQAVEKICAKYEYGKFNGMDDSYEYSNVIEGLPQVKYLFVSNAMSETKKQEVYENIRTNWAGGELLPEKYQDACNLPFHGEWVSTWVWREFCQQEAA